MAAAGAAYRYWDGRSRGFGHAGSPQRLPAAPHLLLLVQLLHASLHVLLLRLLESVDGPVDVALQDLSDLPCVCRLLPLLLLLFLTTCVLLLAMWLVHANAQAVVVGVVPRSWRLTVPTCGGSVRRIISDSFESLRSL